MVLESSVIADQRGLGGCITRGLLTVVVDVVGGQQEGSHYGRLSKAHRK
jgi:hypothetical protein